MNEEIWLPIKDIKIKKKVKTQGQTYTIEDYKYEVSSLGRVRNKGTGYILATHKIGKNESEGVQLSTSGGKYMAKTVANLVATAFIPNPEGLPIVAHINRDKYDNRVSNLKWSSRYSVNKQLLFKKVVCSDGTTYDSIKDASRTLNISRSAIERSLRRGDVIKDNLTFAFSGKAFVQKKLPRISDLPKEEWKKMEGVSPLFEISNMGRVKRIEVDDKPEKLIDSVIVDGCVVTNLSFVNSDGSRYRRQISPMKEVYKTFGLLVDIKASKVYGSESVNGKKRKIHKISKVYKN